MIFRLFTLALLVLSHPLLASLKLNDHSTVVFASVEQGQQLLSRQDDFTQRLSPFDRAARMKTNKHTSTAQYLQFTRQHVQPWQQADQQKVTLAFNTIKQTLSRYPLAFPDQVMMIKTTGEEEGHAAYTRGNAIIFTDKQLAFAQSKLQQLLLHELFHILSRSNPELKQRLYQVIGFNKSNELEFPENLKTRKITNPDAPRNDHFVNLEYQQKNIQVVPILFSRTAIYDTDKGGPFFDYLDFKLLVVRHNPQTQALTINIDNGQPQLLDITEVPDYFNQIGKNTDYIIHPEEILAENFALLLTESRASGSIKSPHIIKKIKQILE
jgi:hypothetical protein